MPTRSHFTDSPNFHVEYSCIESAIKSQIWALNISRSCVKLVKATGLNSLSLRCWQCTSWQQGINWQYWFLSSLTNCFCVWVPLFSYVFQVKKTIQIQNSSFALWNCYMACLQQHSLNRTKETNCGSTTGHKVYHTDLYMPSFHLLIHKGHTISCTDTGNHQM